DVGAVRKDVLNVVAASGVVIEPAPRLARAIGLQINMLGELGEEVAQPKRPDITGPKAQERPFEVLCEFPPLLYEVRLDEGVEFTSGHIAQLVRCVDDAAFVLLARRAGDQPDEHRLFDLVGEARELNRGQSATS